MQRQKETFLNLDTRLNLAAKANQVILDGRRPGVTMSISRDSPRPKVHFKRLWFLLRANPEGVLVSITLTENCLKQWVGGQT